MTEAALFLIAMLGVIDGAVWLIRNELARRGAARVEFPPATTLAVTLNDEVPWL